MEKIRDKNQESAETFALQIDYKRHTENPSRVFRSMSDLIDSFQTIDVDLVSSFDLKIDAILLLEDIQIGSLRSVLASTLRGIDDEALKNLEWQKIVGQFLCRSKHVMLNWLEGKKEISTKGEIELLGKELHFLAEKTEVKHLPYYRPIPLPQIVRDVNLITAALSVLLPEDAASYTALGATTAFNTGFVFDVEVVEEMLTNEIITNTAEVILKVKKPDYLGESMWEFRHGGHVIRVAIGDHDWLLNFQFRKVTVQPGDAIRAQMETVRHYGDDGEEIFTHYTITKVMDVIHGEKRDQPSLPPFDAQ